MSCKHCPQLPWKTKDQMHEFTFQWFWLVSGKESGAPFQGRFAVSHKSEGCLFDQGNAIQAIKRIYPELQITDMVLSCRATPPEKEELLGEMRILERIIQNNIWDRMPIGAKGPADYWSVERKMNFLESLVGNSANIQYLKNKGLDRIQILKARLRFLGI